MCPDANTDSCHPGRDRVALLIFHACVLSSMAHISEICTLKLLEEGAELLRESGGFPKVKAS